MPIQLQYLKAVTLLVVSMTLLTATFILDTYPTPNGANAQIKTVSSSANSKAVTIHRYESPKMDAVNLYWIETAKGIIIIDTGRFVSQASYALTEIQAQTDKPILGILITHPHTDHYGGLSVFAKAAGKDVPIYASEITYNDMKTDEQGFIKARNKLHGNDFPSQETISRYLPNHIVKNGDLIQLAGLKFRVINLPENETLTTTLYYFPEQNALFTGDFVVNQTIPFLGDGNSSNWVRQLRMLLARPELETGTAYPGHGKPAPAKEILQAQLKYIQTVRSLVIEALSSGNEVTPREKTDILAEMKEQYPDYQTSLLLPGLLERGIDGIAQELKKEKVQ